MSTPNGVENLSRKERYFGWLFSIKFLPIIISWVGYGLFVFGYLRPRASSISGSYVLGLSWSSVKVFFSQVIMGLPLVSLRDGDFNFSFFTILGGIVLLVLSHFSFKLLFKSLIRSTKKVEFQNIDVAGMRQYQLLLSLFALTMILSPGFMMAMQPTWWNRADVKHTYLGVMITEFGTAVILGFILDRIIKSNLKTVLLKKNRS